jgi:hypothetical protein
MPTSCLQFVDGITASPTILLDLDDGASWAVDAESTFHPPALRRSTAGSLLTDGEPVAASAYSNRELRLVLKLLTGNFDTDATQVQNLMRQLDKATNLLRYTPAGASTPVFFRVYRSSPDQVNWDRLERKCFVTVLAEPSGLGLREDIATGVTVNNNPAAGSNGLFLDLTDVKGDLETPLFIEYSDGSSTARPGLAIGVRSGSPYPTRFNQAESYPTLLLDTAVVADAAFSGGSKMRVPFGLGQTQHTTRFAGDFPSLTDPAGAENWGLFRVFARVAQTVAGDVITVGISGSTPVTLRSQTGAQVADLGVYDSRSGGPVNAGYTASPYRIENQRAISIQAGRASGSGALDFDYLIFLPADQRLGMWGLVTVTSTSTLQVVDGVNQSVYLATALSGATPGRHASSMGIAGGFPAVRPGSNRLVFAQMETLSGTDALATAFTLNIRYWPRYLYVRPVST